MAYVHTIDAKLQGGDKLRKTLEQINKRLRDDLSVAVGFLESAKYPKRYSNRVKFRISPERSITSVATVAALNEFGTRKIPPRPFFRSMVASKSPRWGNGLALALHRTNFDAQKSLAIMGQVISDQLVESIRATRTPPNAPLTVKIKGFNRPLYDEGILIRSVDFQVLSKMDAF